jgi:hypothetical protein
MLAVPDNGNFIFWAAHQIIFQRRSWFDRIDHMFITLPPSGKSAQSISYVNIDAGAESRILA